MSRKKLEPARAVGDIDNVGVVLGLNVGRKLGSGLKSDEIDTTLGIADGSELGRFVGIVETTGIKEGDLLASSDCVIVRDDKSLRLSDLNDSAEEITLLIDCDDGLVTFS